MKKEDVLKTLGLTHQEPPPARERAGKYRKREYTPCPFCGQIEYECNGAKRQCVICVSTRDGIAYLQSRCCPKKGATGNGMFKLPIG